MCCLSFFLSALQNHATFAADSVSERELAIELSNVNGNLSFIYVVAVLKNHVASHMVCDKAS